MSTVAKATKTPAVMVCVTDSATGVPLARAGVQIPKPALLTFQRTGKRAPTTPERAHWYGITDSTGWVEVNGFPPGEHRVEVYEWLHGSRWIDVHAIRGHVDTLRVALPYLGRRPDGRRDEVHFQVDSIATGRRHHKRKP